MHGRLLQLLTLTSMASLKAVWSTSKANCTRHRGCVCHFDRPHCADGRELWRVMLHMVMPHDASKRRVHQGRDDDMILKLVEQLSKRAAAILQQSSALHTWSPMGNSSTMTGRLAAMPSGGTSASCGEA